MEFPKINLAAGYFVAPDWPSKPDTVEWGPMPGVTLDAEGRVYIFSRSRDPVQVYDSDGRFIRTWGRDLFKRPHYARIDPEGHLWLADCDRHVVERYTTEGELLLRLGTENVSGCDRDHFNEPTDMAITREGEIYVSDGYANSRVVHFDKAGRFVKEWGSLGVEPGQFSLPHSIVVDSNHNVYVAERNNVRVQVFNAEGKHLNEWRGVITPWGLHASPSDDIWVVGSSPMRWSEGDQLGGPPKDQVFMRFDTQGKLRYLWTVPKCEDGHPVTGECNWVHGVAMDARQSLYLTDIRGCRLQKFIYRPEGSELDPPAHE